MPQSLIFDRRFSQYQNYYHFIVLRVYVEIREKNLCNCMWAAPARHGSIDQFSFLKVIMEVEGKGSRLVIASLVLVLAMIYNIPHPSDLSLYIIMMKFKSIESLFMHQSMQGLHLITLQ